MVLSQIPVNSTIPESDAFHDVLSSLEYFIPEIFREIYHEWKYESLDGVLAGTGLKTNNHEAKIAGLAIIISDQTITPVLVHLRIAPDKDEIVWFECKLGELGPDGMIQVPYGCSSNRMDKIAVVDQLDRIEWVYQVSFGAC